MNTAYCFDLDGTLTKEEILPLVSREIGLYEEISALTEATIKGVITFERSFLLRTKILAEIPIARVQNLIKNILLHKQILAFVQQYKENCFVITGNLDVWVKDLSPLIGCAIFCSLADYQDDKLLGVKKILHKGEVVKQLRSKFDRIVAVGDGMGDVAMFEQADISIAFGGVHDPIQSLIQLAHFVCMSEKALCNTLNTLL